MCFVGKTGVELGIVMLSEISETHKDKYCIFSLIVEFEGHDSTKWWRRWKRKQARDMNTAEYYQNTLHAGIKCHDIQYFVQLYAL